MATAKKSAAKKAPEKASDSSGGLAKKVANLQEAVRRIASGQIITEEQKHELLELVS